MYIHIYTYIYTYIHIYIYIYTNRATRACTTASHTHMKNLANTSSVRALTALLRSPPSPYFFPNFVCISSSLMQRFHEFELVLYAPRFFPLFVLPVLATQNKVCFGIGWRLLIGLIQRQVSFAKNPLQIGLFCKKVPYK